MLSILRIYFQISCNLEYSFLIHVLFLVGSDKNLIKSVQVEIMVCKLEVMLDLGTKSVEIYESWFKRCAYANLSVNGREFRLLHMYRQNRIISYQSSVE